MTLILATADLHYGMMRTKDGVEDALRRWAREDGPVDAVVLAGDVAEMVSLPADQAGDHHRALFRQVRGVFGDACQVAFCAGNHDLWVNDDGLDSWAVYTELLPRVAREEGVHYLDTMGPLCLPGVTVVGAMAHYDYSLRDPELRTEGGDPFPEEAFRTKRVPGSSLTVWNDARYLRWERTDAEACEGSLQLLEASLADGLQGEGASPVLVATHHLPGNAVNAWILAPDRRPLTGFFSAFSGTTRLGDLLNRVAAAHPERAFHLVCGHTHRAVDPVDFGRFTCQNIGGDYGSPERVLLTYPA